MEGSTTQSITTSNIFTEATNTLKGFMDMSVEFFNGLWANPMGKVIITIGLASGAIGLCYRLFLRRKHV